MEGIVERAIKKCPGTRQICPTAKITGRGTEYSLSKKRQEKGNLMKRIFKFF